MLKTDNISPQTQIRKELGNLDCLRSFAVLSVMIDHYAMMLASVHGTEPAVWFLAIGYMGVLAFFVHTSIVLMFSLERLSQFPDRLTLRFYLRRAFRIYPLSILCVSGFLILKIPAAPLIGVEFSAPSSTVTAANILLVQNLVGKQSVSAPLWSLPFEVQMYLVLPLCFGVACKRKGVFYAGAGLLSFACIGSVVKYFTGHANLLAYVPCFLAGVLAYTVRHKVRPHLAATVWPLFVCLWIAVSTRLITKWSALDMQIGWAACLLLGLSVFCFHDCRNVLWNRVTHNIAKYSYGLYLGHTAMLWLTFQVWGITNALPGAAVSLTMAALVAVLSYHLVEEPMIGIGQKLTARMNRGSRTGRLWKVHYILHPAQLKAAK